jgi:hypothetical protein
MRDFVPGTRVRAALARDPLTCNLELEIESSGGDITIKGGLCDQNEDVQRVAATVPAVRGVSFEEAELAVPALASPS